MNLKEALQDTGVAEAWHDGYSICVRENERDLNDVYRLSVAVDGMPPHFLQDFQTVEQVEAELREHSAFPVSILNEFESVDPE